MDIYVVDGSTHISWSVMIRAENAEHAEQLAKAYWEHNVTAEDIQAHSVWNETTGEPE